MHRLRIALGALAGLRRHDFRAARTWVKTMHQGGSLPARLLRFCGWALRMLFVAIPDSRRWARFAQPVSRTPVWLARGDPFDDYPFRDHPDAALPERVSAVVIGAGMIGAAAAYHWSKLAREPLLVIEMNGVASGSAGRNEGLVVMGRYYAYVHRTVLAWLERSRPELNESQRTALAHEFAAAYARAAYANAEMIANTIAQEGIDCDYARKGWVQAPGPGGLEALEASTRMASETGFRDWVKISSQEAFEHSGMKTSGPAGFSIGAATWNPAKWVWSLMRIALSSSRVALFTRTKVLRIEDRGEEYAVHTSRGTVLARHLVNATESHTPLLFPQFHDIIQPMQTQAAAGTSDGGAMRAGVGISGERAFYGRHEGGVLFGSDATRVPDREAGLNQPSRFITSFVLTEMQARFGIEQICVTNEWSGTVSYTPDEYPIVGRMDEKRMYMIGGMAGSGSAVAFLAARHIVKQICGIQDGEPDYYPEKYFSAARFRRG
jgi:glycine/D-amino acid oxidase-like deaminating enzyme